jgi:hypothetical protein
MFDAVGVTRSELARELQDRFAPITLSRDRLLPVPDALLPLFPFGGLQKGQSVGFEGTGGWSVALALAGAVVEAGGWVATVGTEELGLVAAAELGVRFDRLLVIGSVAPALAPAVVATLIDAVDVVVLAGGRADRISVSARDARRLEARARERGAVLFHLEGNRWWPRPLDLTLTTSHEGWEGIGRGHGHLRVRRLTIDARGRRSSARRRQVPVLLPGPEGRTTPAPAPIVGITSSRPALTPAG